MPCCLKLGLLISPFPWSIVSLRPGRMYAVHCSFFGTCCSSSLSYQLLVCILGAPTTREGEHTMETGGLEFPVFREVSMVWKWPLVKAHEVGNPLLAFPTSYCSHRLRNISLFLPYSSFSWKSCCFAKEETPIQNDGSSQELMPRWAAGAVGSRFTHRAPVPALLWHFAKASAVIRSFNSYSRHCLVPRHSLWKVVSC